MPCLEKNPNRRPQSAAELAADLAALSFESSWSQERAALWWRAHDPTGRGAGAGLGAPTGGAP
jgi:serine/threonine-protein kinase